MEWGDIILSAMGFMMSTAKYLFGSNLGNSIGFSDSDCGKLYSSDKIKIKLFCWCEGQ